MPLLPLVFVLVDDELRKHSEKNWRPYGIEVRKLLTELLRKSNKNCSTFTSKNGKTDPFEHFTEAFLQAIAFTTTSTSGFCSRSNR